MRQRLTLLLLFSVSTALSTAVIADDSAPVPTTLAATATETATDTATAPALDELEIADDIRARASDPLISPEGVLPSPVPTRKMAESPGSTLFYALPLIGFWLIFRRRGRGVRL